jgi:ABC-2 type transport system ATP-binding protein
VPDGLDAIAGVHDLSVEDHTVTCTVEPEALPKVLRRLTESGVIALDSAPPTLEELFLDAYRTQPA